MSSLPQRGLTHLGMDVHRDSNSIGILRPDDGIDVERIFNDEESVRRFIGRFPEPCRLVACYEAGPTGYELHRLLQAPGGPLPGGSALAHPQSPRGPGEDRPA